MARKQTLEVQISGDAKQLNRALDKSRSGLDKLGKQTRLTGVASSRGFTALRVGATGAAAAFGGLALAGKELAQATIEAEKSNARMQAQLKASGISFKAHGAEIEQVIQKHSRLAGLDDEDLQDAFTNIVRVTGDVDKSLRLVGLASDFARGKQIDVAKAGEIVAKVAGGNIGVLGRYGIKVKEGATAQEALAQLQAKFAGQAKAYGETTAGAVDRAKVSFENIKETAGTALAPTVERVATAFSKFTTQMQNGTGAGGRFAAAAKQVWSDLQPVRDALASVGRTLIAHPKLITGLVLALAGLKIAFVVAKGVVVLRGALAGLSIVKGLVTAFWALNAAMVANPVGLVVAALAALGVGLVIAYKKSATFRQVVGAAFSVVRKIAADAFAVITFGMRQFLVGIGKIAAVASKVPGMGWLKGVSKAALGAAAQLKVIEDRIRGIPNKKSLKFDVTLTPEAKRNLRDLNRRGRVPGPQGLRDGGKIKRFADGGLVPILAAGGEELHDRGRVTRIPGRPDRDETLMFARQGSSVVTADGQARMAMGASLSQAVAQQLPHFMAGGRVAGLMRKAGFKARNLITGLAVSKGESGWNERASNRNSDGSIDRGLFQINSIHGAKSTFDPQGNANAAWSISGRGRNWNPWVVFRRGLHKRHLPAAIKAAATAGGDALTGLAPRGLTPRGLVPGAFSAAYEAAVGGTRYDAAAAAMENVSRRLGDRAPRASTPRTGGTRSGLPDAVQRMLTKGRQIAAKGYSYSYGGGHNANFSGPYDCSGLVSAILHAGGALRRPMAVVQPMASALQRGKGKHVTVGMRGSSGKSAHCMMNVAGKYFESANSLGKTGYRKGWSGNFQKYHPKGFSRGGVVGALGALRTAKGARTGPLLRKLQRELRGATPNQMFGYLKMAQKFRRTVGGKGAITVIQAALGTYAGRQAGQVEATLGAYDSQTTDFTNALIVGGGDPESAAGRRALIGVKQQQLAASVGALGQLQRALKVAQRSKSKKTVKDLQGRIGALQSSILGQQADIVTSTRDLARDESSDANQALIDAIQAWVEIAKAHTDALNENAKQTQAQVAFANQVVMAENKTLSRYLAETVSQYMAAGLNGRSLTPGAGARGIY